MSPHNGQRTLYRYKILTVQGIPASCGVMFLSGITLFPGTQLPLHIFEKPYCHMLAKALECSRMFAIAMAPPQETPENPMPIVGLGMITTCVQQKNGTANLMLTGIQRIRLLNVLHETPFQAHSIEPVNSINDTIEPEKFIIQKLIDICESRIPEAQHQALETLKELKSLDQLTDQICALLVESANARHELMQTLSLRARVDILKRLLTIPA